MSSWSRERRSSASASTISNLPACASCMSCWMPGRIRLAPEIAAIGIDVHDLPALARGALPAQPHLVLDRGVALLVGGVAGVDRGAGHGLSCWRRSISLWRRHDPAPPRSWQDSAPAPPAPGPACCLAGSRRSRAVRAALSLCVARPCAVVPAAPSSAGHERPARLTWRSDGRIPGHGWPLCRTTLGKRRGFSAHRLTNS